MKAMILAAGRGERMRPLTDDRPKPLLDVGGKPLIDYHIEALILGGIRDVVINLSWHGEQIRDYLGSGDRYGISVAYSDEGAEALETGGGIHKALPLLGPEPFWLINGDVYSDYKYSQTGLDAGVVGHLVMVPNPPHNPKGDFCLNEQRIKSTGKPRLTYSGISVLDPALLIQCSPGKFPLAPLFKTAAEHDALTGEVFHGLWRDIGTPERLSELDQQLQAAFAIAPSGPPRHE
jgi:MurNAc alpha-1-phosphate uridylyltransferase